MRIGIIGTHCSGKTSLISKLYSKVEFENYSFFEEPIRIVQYSGFKVNQDSDDASQLAMLAIHLKNLETENFVSDRTLLDLYIYGKTLNNVTKSTLYFIKKLMLNNINKYDYLFLCKPEFKLVSDGFRSSDKLWQKKIDMLFNKEVQSLKKNNKLKHCKIIQLSGQTKDRVDAVLHEVFKNGK